MNSLWQWRWFVAPWPHGWPPGHLLSSGKKEGEERKGRGGRGGEEGRGGGKGGGGGEVEGKKGRGMRDKGK